MIRRPLWVEKRAGVTLPSLIKPCMRFSRTRDKRGQPLAQDK
jgi:hypothetical protein